jgi:hypothetical protein
MLSLAVGLPLLIAIEGAMAGEWSDWILIYTGDLYGQLAYRTKQSDSFNGKVLDIQWRVRNLTPDVREMGPNTKSYRLANGTEVTRAGESATVKPGETKVFEIDTINASSLVGVRTTLINRPP